MDMTVKRCVDELLRSLRSCSEYREYEQARQKLDEDPRKRKKTDEFRRKNFLLQNSEEGRNMEAQQQISQERRELRRDPVIDEYLRTELAMCRLLRQISLRLMDSVDLDLDSMEDILS